MPLNLKSHEELTNDAVALWAAELGLSPFLKSGDPLLAIMHALSAQALWLQALVNMVNKYARASTAEGEDLDSWMADYGFKRLPAVKARGECRFLISNPRSENALIPPGARVQTAGGGIVYEVIKDTTQAHWDEAVGAYKISAGSTYADCTVQAIVAGSASNVQALNLKQQSSTIIGIDEVKNLASISNGQDPEIDQKLRNRFILFINSLSKGTNQAVLSAALNVQSGLDVRLVANKDQSGEDRDGYFTVVIDDGSGEPNSDLLQAVTDAIAPVRAFTIDYVVIAPELLDAEVELNIKIKPTSNESTVLTQVQAAVIEYVNNLKIGETLYVYNLVAVALANPGVQSVQPNSVKINDTEDDLDATEYQVVRTNALSCDVSSYV